jgi:peptidoglycan/xylan/chitin deacetylase (PgdA/CDA1 family)
MRRRALLSGLASGPVLSHAPAMAQPRPAPPRGGGTLYLTIDTGWSREAEHIADVMRRHAIRATLFIANERTHRGDRQLEDSWAPFWQARAAEGHAFATHTWRHWYFRGDPSPGRVAYTSRQGEGGTVLDQAGLCEELARPLHALRRMVPDAPLLPLWRAPGGITTPGARRLGEGCGLRHQGWTARGFLGDELPSDAHSNATLLRQNLARIRDGEVLVMHWGVRSRRDPFGAIFEPLVTGLLERGFRFETLPPGGIAT